mgnify:CR=1 FL=1
MRASAPALPSEPTAASLNGPTALSVRRLNEWAAAWEAKEVDRYLAFYAPEFRSDRGDTDGWKAQRRRLVTQQRTQGLEGAVCRRGYRRNVCHLGAPRGARRAKVCAN